MDLSLSLYWVGEHTRLQTEDTNHHPSPSRDYHTDKVRDVRLMSHFLSAGGEGCRKGVRADSRPDTIWSYSFSLLPLTQIYCMYLSPTMMAETHMAAPLRR